METVSLKALEEWRLDVPNACTVTVQLLQGQAEMMGVELSPNLEYSIVGPLYTSIASFKGCTFEYVASSSCSSYVSSDAYISPIFNLHWALKASPIQPQRFLVLGQKDTGKTTMCRTLASYMQRVYSYESEANSLPYLVNLDPHLPHVSIPSQLSIIPLNSSLLPVGPLLADSAGTTHISPITTPTFPLIYNNGFHNHKENPTIYSKVVSQMADDLNRRLGDDKNPVIIDTPPFNISDWQIIDEIVTKFKVTTIVVLANERFVVDLNRKLNNANEITILNLPKSSGVVDKDPKYERTLQQSAIRTYFYGCPIMTQPKGTHQSNSTNAAASSTMATTVTTSHTSNTLNPYTLHINISELVFLRPVENVEFDANVDQTKTFEKIESPTEMDLINCILALVDDTDLSIGNTDELIKNVTNKSTHGFAYVQSVNEQTKKIKILIPSPVRTLPTKVAIVTEMRYIE